MLEYTDVSYFAFSHFGLCIFRILYFALCSGRVYGGRLAGRPVGEGSDYDRVTLGVTIELATTQYTTKHKIHDAQKLVLIEYPINKSDERNLKTIYC